MSYQVIKQPDGKLAIFSTETDQWIRRDWSPDEVVEWFAERAAEDVRRHYREVTDLVVAGREREVYCQFALTFAEANAYSWDSDGEVLPGPVDEEFLVELQQPLDDTADT